MANVPRLPGVPPLPSFSADSIVLILQDALLPFAIFGAPQWGIFLDGAQILPMNSMNRFSYKQDWAIADYPIEQGGFQSYDKVENPFECRVRITSGGTSAARQDLLQAVDQIAASLDLYDIVTPEKVYTSVNVSHYDFERTSDHGVGMLVIDLWFIEIRISAQANFTDTKSPTNASQQNIGNVQADNANAYVQQSFDSGLWKVQ